MSPFPRNPAQLGTASAQAAPADAAAVVVDEEELRAAALLHDDLAIAWRKPSLRAHVARVLDTPDEDDFEYRVIDRMRPYLRPARPCPMSKPPGHRRHADPTRRDPKGHNTAGTSGNTTSAFDDLVNWARTSRPALAALPHGRLLATH